MKDVVIVFARVPRLGTVKRRLARGIGDLQAKKFHTQVMDRLLRALANERRFRTIAALTPDRARMRLPQRVQRIAQGDGDLGQRMQRAFARFPNANVVLVGCDIPELDVGDVRLALQKLGQVDAAFGPAEDGGYWLVAMSPRRPARPFAAVRWSGEHTLADNLANFSTRRVALLRRLDDIDTVEDFQRWQKRHSVSQRHSQGFPNALALSPEAVSPPDTDRSERTA